MGTFPLSKLSRAAAPLLLPPSQQGSQYGDGYLINDRCRGMVFGVETRACASGRKGSRKNDNVCFNDTKFGRNIFGEK
jgi:hypothetical protein